MTVPSDPLVAFGPATRAWFQAAFPAPTPVQVGGWAAITAGHHALLLAPTGSGKTLAAFLWALDRLHHAPAAPAAPAGVRVLYVSPMKALVHDVERNLRTPLAGIQAAARGLGLSLSAVRVRVRTGDTPPSDRAAFQRDPGDVLVTTPESLYLLLSSAARARLATVETVIVDEIHAVAGTKRGVHLALSLERLQELVTRGGARPAPQRIGLSATQRPLSEIASFLGGVQDGRPRPVEIVDRAAPPAVDLRVVVPVAQMERATAVVPLPAVPAGLDPDADGLPALAATGRASPAPSSTSGDRQGIWPAIHAAILDLVRAHRSTIVFTNSRRLCERLAQRLNELWAEQGHAEALVRAHHGSVSHAERAEIEELLKAGRLRGIVATSSLELGIDMGAVDLVVMVESPGAVSRGLQRVGRAGHQVGQTSVGRLFPKFRGDLLEAAVVVRQMMAAEIEPTTVPTNCLDVLAQHLVSACLEGEQDRAHLLSLVRGAWPYRSLGQGPFDAVLDMLSGRLPGDDQGELRPRLVWDRAADRLRARGGARLAVFSTPGTIPDRGLYGVYLAGEPEPATDGRTRRPARGRRLGELDEEMVYESRNGDVILLGASSWRIVEIQRDRVLVAPAPGQPGRMPFWRGEGPGRPLGLGQAMGAFVRELSAMTPPDAHAHLVGACHLEPQAAENLLGWLDEQRQATGVVPSDRAITVERFRDEVGDWRICILSPFGARVHAPWAMALEATLGDPARGGGHTGLQSMWTDDGIVLRFPDLALPAGGDDDAPVLAPALPDLHLLLPDPDQVEELVLGQLRHTALFAARFREAAARALLLTRKSPGRRTPLWAQRLAAQRLMALAAQDPSFPVALEAWRECLQDVFDLPALRAILSDVHARRIAVHEVETPSPSPFARGLALAYVADFLYDGDAPLAERKAQALSLDRGLLRELLGQEELAGLLDPDVLRQVQDELQGLDPDRRARSADGLWDLLWRVGDLAVDEVDARCGEGLGPRLREELLAQRRVAWLRVAGQPRLVVAEDVVLYRDALGCAPPAGLPAALLEARPDPLRALVGRFARAHGPFSTEQVAARLGLLPALVLPVLELLRAEGRLEHGPMRADQGGAAQWCDEEVLRRLKRRTLARLRGEVAPVEAPVLARFCLAWQGVWTGAGRPPPRPGALDDAIVQLEGCALPWGELVRRILPARVPGFRPEALDALGTSGAVVWLGQGRLSARDGAIVLLRREQVPLLAPDPGQPPAERVGTAWSPLHAAVLTWLEERGACFSVELHQAAARTLGHAVRGDEVDQALWDLAWAGLVTNDSFHPLRALLAGARRPQPAAAGRTLPRPSASAAPRGR
ncbi:DEAD/DEAH box helicase, partial [Myxococcota bacterium]|nr:DEAD/DEAH box helicase [Myxococcota bacterium]